MSDERVSEATFRGETLAPAGILVCARLRLAATAEVLFLSVLLGTLPMLNVVPARVVRTGWGKEVLNLISALLPDAAVVLFFLELASCDLTGIAGEAARLSRGEGDLVVEVLAGLLALTVAVAVEVEKMVEAELAAAVVL